MVGNILVWMVVWGFTSQQHFKVISGWVLTFDSVRSWWLYSAAPLANQATGAMTRYSIQSHYPDTGITSPCPILMPYCNAECQARTWPVVWLGWWPDSRSPACKAPALLIRPPRPLRTKPRVGSECHAGAGGQTGRLSTAHNLPMSHSCYYKATKLYMIVLLWFTS